MTPAGSPQAGVQLKFVVNLLPVAGLVDTSGESVAPEGRLEADVSMIEPASGSTTVNVTYSGQRQQVAQHVRSTDLRPMVVVVTACVASRIVAAVRAQC
jgi:hypothetical protein